MPGLVKVTNKSSKKPSRVLTIEQIFSDTKFGEPIPRLLVPKVVSFNSTTKRGYVTGGTKAFVPNGIRLARGLSRENKWQALRVLAQSSKFFIKPLSARNKKIREVLAYYGIKTEEVMQELGDGTALFKRTGIPLDSKKGQKLFAKNPKKFSQALQKTFVTMLILEINHRHPHMGNFTISKNGEVFVIDLSAARIGTPEKLRTVMDNAKIRRAADEMNYFCDSLAGLRLLCVNNAEPTREQLFAEKKVVWDETTSMTKKVYPLLVEKTKHILKLKSAQEVFRHGLSKL